MHIGCTDLESQKNIAKILHSFIASNSHFICLNVSFSLNTLNPSLLGLNITT